MFAHRKLVSEGDYLISYNGQSLEGVSKEDCSVVLRQETENVSMEILRKKQKTGFAADTAINGWGKRGLPFSDSFSSDDNDTRNRGKQQGTDDRLKKRSYNFSQNQLFARQSKLTLQQKVGQRNKHKPFGSDVTTGMTSTEELSDEVHEMIFERNDPETLSSPRNEPEEPDTDDFDQLVETNQMVVLRSFTRTNQDETCYEDLLATQSQVISNQDTTNHPAEKTFLPSLGSSFFEPPPPLPSSPPPPLTPTGKNSLDGVTGSFIENSQSSLISDRAVGRMNNCRVEIDPFDDNFSPYLSKSSHNGDIIKSSAANGSLSMSSTSPKEVHSESDVFAENNVSVSGVNRIHSNASKNATKTESACDEVDLISSIESDVAFDKVMSDDEEVEFDPTPAHMELDQDPFDDNLYPTISNTISEIKSHSLDPVLPVSQTYVVDRPLEDEFEIVTQSGTYETQGKFSTKWSIKSSTAHTVTTDDNDSVKLEQEQLRDINLSPDQTLEDNSNLFLEHQSLCESETINCMDFSQNKAVLLASKLKRLPKSRSESEPFQINVLQGLSGLGMELSATSKGPVVEAIQKAGPVGRNGNIRSVA